MARWKPIPVLLLKTKSQPHDAYEDFFSDTTEHAFQPLYVPVLQHRLDEVTLRLLGRQLQSGKLKREYGGMIFTSQRAVEAWANTVGTIQLETSLHGRQERGENVPLTQTPSDNPAEKSEPVGNENTHSQDQAIDIRSGESFTTDILTTTPFPLYTVGPATARALNTLIQSATGRTVDIDAPDTHSSSSSSSSPLTELAPQVYGEHTGNGANLAQYILEHYNQLHTQTCFTHYEAPRLPFIPLVGMGSENYSRKRLEADDPRLQKKPLLFLVGEQRRDIIPQTLMARALGTRSIKIDQIEVYSTTVMPSFRHDLDSVLASLHRRDHDHESMATAATEERQVAAEVVAIVVFSPQGTIDMLRAVGYLDDTDNPKPTSRSKARWYENAPSPSAATATTASTTAVATATEPATPKAEGARYIIVTVGPTTRDHMITKLGVAPDVCAAKPSPAGVGEAIVRFLDQYRHLLSHLSSPISPSPSKLHLTT